MPIRMHPVAPSALRAARTCCAHHITYKVSTVCLKLHVVQKFGSVSKTSPDLGAGLLAYDHQGAGTRQV
eukprot:2620-Heterococcus_DN1.PRE.3